VFDTPLLAREVVSESGGAFELRNGLQVDVLAGDWRSIRGFTLVAAIVDEVAFFGLEEECRVRSDTELIRAIRPALATTGGKLLGITTPYARKGYCWQTYKRHFGVDKAPVLVWNCPSRMMNPTLPQSVVDAAMAEDRQAALSEYMGQFRDDVAEFLPRSLIEGLVVPGRRELLPRVATRYSAFVDVSGGRHDEAALAVGHKQGRRVVVDMLRRYRPPFNPHDVVRQMVDALRPYHVRGVVGDNYAAEWVAGAFRAYGTGYTKCPKAKSPLYLELLPRLCSGEIELLDDEQAVDQLSNLERRTRSGGKDVVDHPPGGHDDLANAIAGLADTVAGPGGRVIGGFTSLARARHERILTGGTI
jgi:hypothetical protein